MRETRRGLMSGPPPTCLENHKPEGFLRSTAMVPTPEKSQSYPPSKHSVSSQYRPASETTFKLRFAGGPMLAR